MAWRAESRQTSQVPRTIQDGTLKRALCLLFLAVGGCRHDTTSPRVGSLAAIIVVPQNDLSGDRSGNSASTTFESFAIGAIDGQHDWQSFGGIGAPPDPLHSHCAVYDHEIADLRALGTGSNRLGPFQRRSLRVSNAITSGCYGDQTFSSRDADVAGEAGASSRSRDGLTDYGLPGARLRTHFDAEWDFASTVPSALQSGLEVVASPARGDDHRMSWVRMRDLADGLAVDFVERSSANPDSAGAFRLTSIATRLDRRIPHTIKLSIDFVDGPSNDVVKVVVDGEHRFTGTSWENYYHFDANGSANFSRKTPAVNRLLFRTGSDVHRGFLGTSAPATRGHGFLIDNVRVSTSSRSMQENDEPR